MKLGFAVILLPLIIACDGNSINRVDKGTPTAMESPYVPFIDADFMAGLDIESLDIEFGVPFNVSTYVDGGVIVSQDRFYHLNNVNNGAILQVYIVHDVFRDTHNVIRIKITFEQPYQTSDEALKECGFDVDTLDIAVQDERFVRYTGKTEHHEWVGINAYMNNDDLWAVCIMEVKLG